MKPRTYMALPARLWFSQFTAIITASAYYLAKDSGIEWLTAALGLLNAISAVILIALTIIDQKRIWAVYVQSKKSQPHDKGGGK